MRPYTVYAHWTMNSYSVHFDANGGTGEMAPLAMTVGTAAALPACVFSNVAHAFAGWAAEPEGEVLYADGAEVLDLALAQNAAVTLYAVWADEASAVTITLDANDGIGSTKTINAVKNSTIYFSKYAGIFTQDYATLTGFKKDASGESADYSVSSYSSSMTVTEATTLYAHWKENPKIPFDANGGEAGDGSTKAYQYLAGSYEYSGLSWTFVPKNETTASTGKETVTLNENTFTRDGYAFRGWATNAGFTTAQYEDKGSYTFTRSTVLFVEAWSEPTLYAVWKKIPTITYNTNGGSNTATFTEKSLTVTSAVPTAKYSYYTFAGWSTSGSATSASYTAGDELNFADEAVTLYAVWKLGTIVSAKSISVAKNDTESIASFTLLKNEPVKLTVSSADGALYYIFNNGSTDVYTSDKIDSATNISTTLSKGTYTLKAQNKNILNTHTATVTLKGN